MMKKLILFFSAMLIALSAMAEQKVGSYYCSYFNRDFTIEAVAQNDRLKTVYIGVEAKDARTAFISVDGKDLEIFRTSIELLRDKYLEWVKVAKDNNITDMRKNFDIKFPSVNIAWLGTKWWFSFGNKITMEFIILDNGKMVASWAPKVTSSTNRYIDETIYFVFADEKDFNNLIDQLDYESILNQLLNTQNNQDLFK